MLKELGNILLDCVKKFCKNYYWLCVPIKFRNCTNCPLLTLENALVWCNIFVHIF